MTAEEKIKKALEIAVSYGNIDGAHHKMWTIDQMVRALTGCPMVEYRNIDSKGQEYSCEIQGESEEYTKLVHEYQYGTPEEIAAGEFDGEEAQYDWDTGTPP